MPDRQPGPPSATRWLFAQAAAFGCMAALLGIGANAMFLVEFGSGWLPVTYLLIGLAGIAVSGSVAAASRRGDLVRIATTVLGGGAAVLLASWVIAALTGGAWVSAPLLVAFPILLQLGFVFIGAQAGRLLDLAGIKSRFPVIMSGFPVGAVAGGLLAPAILAVWDRIDDLLLACAVAQVVFVALVVATAARFPSQIRSPGNAVERTSVPTERPPMRVLLGQPFVLLLLGYQVWSAIGSQLSDFLVYDRAAALYSDGEDLARFVSWYTAAMNLVAIVVLAVVSGPLLRRYGLRLGISANPAVLAACGVLMIATISFVGAASAALLAVVSFARIADIALTDGMTRTSLNTSYQVLPAQERLTVQTAVEGVGVPIAITGAGALILVLDALPFAVEALVVATTLVCAVWTWTGARLYRSYRGTLTDALRQPSPLEDAAFRDDRLEELATIRVLAEADERDLRIGLDLALAMSSPALLTEIRRLSSDGSPDVRIAALSRLVALGEDDARTELRALVERHHASDDALLREEAARASGQLDASARASVVSLLTDAAPAVRCAALDSIRSGDAHAVDAAVAALAAVQTRRAATGAVRRLGDLVAPTVLSVLDEPRGDSSGEVRRLVRTVALTSQEARSRLAERLEHPDRDIGLAVIEALIRRDPAPDPLVPAVDATIATDEVHAARLSRALTSFGDDPAAEPVRWAARDELDLVRQRIRSLLRLRFGDDEVGVALRALDDPRARQDLAVEAVSVSLGGHASRLLPLLRPDTEPAALADHLAMPPEGSPDREGWLTDMVTDEGSRWRSDWLRSCAAATLTASRIPPGAPGTGHP